MKKTVNRIEDMDVFKKVRKAEELSKMLGGLIKSLTGTDTNH